MPSHTFDVESYSVLTTQIGFASGGAWRSIGLTSPALAHGIRNRATIYFFESPGTLGVVGNVDQPNFNGRSVSAFCRKADFPDWYDMLRNEKPLKFGYIYDGAEFDPNQSIRTLRSVSLFTGEPEPPGEGPEQLIAQRFPAEMVQMLKRADK